MIKDFIELGDFTGEQLRRLIDRALDDKALFQRGELPPALPRKVLAMIFEKPSLRTRVSFEAAMTHLGGAAIYLSQNDIGLGKREATCDIARVLGRMADGIMARTFSHDMVVELAEFSDVPVVNGLTDHSHPCQAMADLMTVQEWFSATQRDRAPLHGRTLAFVGDGNNVARSLAMGCAKLGARFVLSAPGGYELDRHFVARVRSAGGDDCYVSEPDPALAVRTADVVYTDTWVSMGQEDERAKRQDAFGSYQVSSHLMSHAPSHAIVLHCLPAYRGSEITDEIMELHAPTILEQSANRLHFQRTLLNVLMGEGGIE